MVAGWPLFLTPVPEPPRWSLSSILSILFCIGTRNQAILGINDLAIEHNFRKKGYGKALLENAIKDLNNKGTYSTIRLLTTPDNIPALKLYEKVGFKRYKGTTSLSYDPTDILDSLFDQHAKAYQY